jgi:PAS domain S-box-containing protein
VYLARALAECAWLFRGLTENLDQCVFVLDRESRCIAANDRFCRWLKRPHAEILRQPLAAFWPYPLSDQEAAAHERILRGEWIEVEEKGQRGGQFSVIRIRKAPLRDAEGTVCGILCMFREVPVEPSQETRFLDKTILLVESDLGIALLTTTLLSQWGFRVLFSEDGRLAVEMYRDKRREIDLVVVEENLPEQSGLELVNELLAINPRLAIVLVSGTGAAPSWQSATSGLSFLSKPYTPEQLIRCLWTALSAARNGDD